MLHYRRYRLQHAAEGKERGEVGAIGKVVQIMIMPWPRYLEYNLLRLLPTVAIIRSTLLHLLPLSS